MYVVFINFFFKQKTEYERRISGWSSDVCSSDLAVMRSHKRLTYTQVWNAVGDGVPGEDREQARAFIGDQMPQVERLHQLYQVLDKARRQRGAIDFETSEVRFVLGPQGEVTQAGMIQRNDAHKLNDRTGRG